MITSYHSLRDAIEQYDNYIIDLWGVIHDGQHTYDGAKEALLFLQQHHKTVILLSNAPRRAYKAQEGLERLGISSEYYTHLVTSGEVAFEHFAHQNQPKHLGTRYYVIGPERDHGLLNELPEYQQVDTIEEASFVITVGFDHDASTMEDKLPELHAANALKLPMVGVNPDRVIVRINGTRALCAGLIVEEYETMGGTTWQFGKPYPEVYQKCFSLIAKQDTTRTLAIGDNLHTDIQGANNRNIDSVLIAGGILAESLGISHGELPDIAKLEAICQQEGITPTAILPAFIA